MIENAHLFRYTTYWCTMKSIRTDPVSITSHWVQNDTFTCNPSDVVVMIQVHCNLVSYLMQNNKFLCNDTYMYLRFDTGINTCNKSNVLFMKVYCNLVIQNIHYINYMTEQ